MWRDAEHHAQSKARHKHLPLPEAGKGRSSVPLTAHVIAIW
jgi:hypothetical protein